MYSSQKLYLFAVVTVLLSSSTQGQVFKDEALKNAAAIEDTRTDDLILDDIYELFGEDGFKANSLTDKVISEALKRIDKEKLNRITIPDFEQRFKRKIAGLTITGSVKGQNGWLESLNTLERRGEARAYLNDTSFYLSATVGLRTLKIGMKYQARFSLVRSSGDLTATVRSNSVSFLAGIDRSSPVCRLVLKSLKVEELGKIDVEFSKSSGILDTIKSTVVSWIADRFKKQIQNLVEVKMRDKIESELAKRECPDLPFF